MAKNPNKIKDAAPSAASVAGSTSEDQNGAGKPAKAATKTSRKRSAGAPRKTTAGDTPRKPAVRKKATPSETAVSDEEIRLRAYFLAEQRAQGGLRADAASDWLEARRQLLEEAGKRA